MNMDIILGPGKGIERSNQIAPLALSYDSLTTGMQQCHCLLYELESPAYIHVVLLTNQIREWLTWPFVKQLIRDLINQIRDLL